MTSTFMKAYKKSTQKVFRILVVVLTLCLAWARSSNAIKTKADTEHNSLRKETLTNRDSQWSVCEWFDNEYLCAAPGVSTSGKPFEVAISCPDGQNVGCSCMLMSIGDDFCDYCVVCDVDLYTGAFHVAHDCSNIKSWENDPCAIANCFGQCSDDPAFYSYDDFIVAAEVVVATIGGVSAVCASCIGVVCFKRHRGQKNSDMSGIH